MQAAKDVVKKFTSKDGHHDTSVHETVNPAVTNETIHRQQEERIHPAVDKEVHQDHYHTSVQPVHDKEVLREQHHHRAAGVEHRNFEHGDHQASKDLHTREAGQFKDQTTRVEGEKTRTVQPTVGAEHVHHHVHEQIQPVVHKQTVEPHIVHTTQPIHETHHNEAKHHQTSTLPAVGIDEFKQGGGVLTGRGERVDGFDGCPKGVHTSGGTGTSGLSGTHSNTLGDRDNSMTDRINASNTTSTTGHHNTTSGLGGHNSSSHTGTGTTGTTGASGAAVAGAQSATHKASLMDKINPSRDADGDGVKGFMK